MQGLLQFTPEQKPCRSVPTRKSLLRRHRSPANFRRMAYHRHLDGAGFGNVESSHFYIRLSSLSYSWCGPIQNHTMSPPSSTPRAR